jgi:hypothetical protein
MESLFLETEKMASETLIIIGNGFDIAHGIKSTYGSFRDWLMEKKESGLIGLMDTFFSNKRDVWNDIEKALGEYDEESILSFCRPDEEFDYDHSLSSSARIEDSPMAIFQPVLEQFKDKFDEWVESIEIFGADRIIELSPNCRYLTFNYTDTLETIYGIPKKNIVHIHGSRLVHDEYIIGHNHYRDSSDVWDEESLIFESQAMESIIELMNDFVKDYRRNIDKYSDFFSKLSEIKQVICYGHSMNEVDWRYFEEIIQRVGKDVPWRISCYCKEDFDNVHEFKSHYGLANVSTFQM